MKAKLSDLQPWAKNPKTIDERHTKLLTASILTHPETVELYIDGRDNKTILSGNQTYEILKGLGWEEVEIKIADIQSDQDAVEFALNMNMQQGRYLEDQLQELVMEYPELELENFEIELNPITIGSLDTLENIGQGEEFSLPDGDRSPFRQMTFTLADTQADNVEMAIKTSKTLGEIETYDNENSNGNALYRIIKEWLEVQKK